MTLRNEKARNAINWFSNREGKLMTNKTSIARYLLKEHPLVFDNVKQARAAIAYITGNSGKKLRKNIKNKEQIMESKKVNQYCLGEEMHNDVNPYIIGLEYSRVGIVSDIHIPYQDNAATTLALDYLKKKKIDCLVLNGDIIDFYGASSFIRDPGNRDLKYELDAASAFLTAVRIEFPNIPIIYKEGNHEYRWKRFLLLKAPEVFNMAEFRLDIILNLHELNITWVDNKKIIKAGKLNIIHGHEYFGSYSPVNPAKGYYNKAMTNVLAGHNHQVSEHISKDLNDEISGAWSVGCLCEMHPDYLPYNKWQHGFAMVDIERNSNFRVINKMILDGKIV